MKLNSYFGNQNPANSAKEMVLVIYIFDKHMRKYSRVGFWNGKFEENGIPSITRNVDEAYSEMVKFDSWGSGDGFNNFTKEEEKYPPRYQTNGKEKANVQRWFDENYPLPRKPIAKGTRQLIYEKYDGRCAYCGKEITPRQMQIDHLIPHVGQCGEDTLENYMPSCIDCNHFKSNMTLEKFRERIAHTTTTIKTSRSYESHRVAMNYGLILFIDKPIKFYFEQKEEIK